MTPGARSKIWISQLHLIKTKPGMAGAFSVGAKALRKGGHLDKARADEEAAEGYELEDNRANRRKCCDM